MATAAGSRSTGEPTSITTAAPRRVERFTRTERAVHWVQAIGFLLLLITGFVLALPQFEGMIGHRELLREIHLTSAFLFAFGPTIVALSGDRASLGRDVRAVDNWDADDLRWLVPFPILRLFGVRTPPQGRFNAGQKLNAIFVAWSTLTFVVTGFILWQNRRFPLDIVSKSNDVHTLLAYVALAAFLGHLFLATIYPPTRPAFRAITEGTVDEAWAVKHHPKWVAEGLSRRAPSPMDGMRTAIQIVLGSAIVLQASRILFFAIGANTTDRVTGRLYDLTAWPGNASVLPATGVHVMDWSAVGYIILLSLGWVAADRLRGHGTTATATQ
jgi:formate dehydrogenase subunit gamma